MEYKEALHLMESYPKGTVLHVKWDRGNGEITRSYVFEGFDKNRKPILKLFESGRISHCQPLDISYLEKSLIEISE